MRSGAMQSSPISHPDIRLTIGSDVYTSQDGGRLTRAHLDEMPWGGQYVFEIDNADESLSSKDYEGSQATIHLSFIGSSGSNMSPVWVHNQQLISKEGKLLLQLNCIDAWGLLSQVNADLAMAAYNQNWQQSSELDDRKLPSGEDIPAALKTAIAANYGKTIFEIVEDLVGTIGKTASLDDDDGIVNTREPPMRISNPISGIRQALDMTKCYLKWKTGGTFGTYQPDAHATAYTFDAANLIFNNLEDVAVVIPNRVTFYALNAAGDDWISGSDYDADSYAKLGNLYIDRHYLLANFSIDGRSTTTELAALATGALAKIQGERSQGVVVAPMHCSLQLFDKIQIDDYMYGSPRSTTGYVHRLIREYDRGVYRITIQVGGLTKGYTPPGGNDPMPLADGVGDNTVAQVPQGGLTIGAYIADVSFTSVDWDTVSWGAGLVTLADGRSQSVNSGSYNMLADGAHYFYVILGNSTMQVSQTATDAVGSDRMLVAVASRGSSTDYSAYVMNPFTDSILINTDKVMDGLVTELKLANEAVTNAKIAVNAIQGDVIAANAIQRTMITDDAVDTPQLRAGAVTTYKIDTYAITASKIEANAVTAAKIQADAVTADKIKAGAVTAVKIDAYAVEAIKIAANAITASKLAATIILSSTIKTASSGARVQLDSGGIQIEGQKLDFTYGDTMKGRVYVNASHLILYSASSWSISINAGSSDNVEMTAQVFDMDGVDHMDLPRDTNYPASKDGRMYHNLSTDFTHCYTDGAWRHINYDAD